MATIARRASIVSVEKIYSSRRATCALEYMMREEEKEDKVEVAEGLSQ